MHGVEQQVDAVDDHRGGPNALHDQQHNAIPGVLLAQVEGLGDTHVQVEQEGSYVVQEQDPAHPAGVVETITI